MRVYNLTDVATQPLKAAGLIGVSIKVSGVTVAPGKSAPINAVGPDAARYLSVGAIHVGDNPPKGYTPAPPPPERPAARKSKPEPALMPTRIPGPPAAPPRKTLALDTKVDVNDSVSVSKTSSKSRGKGKKGKKGK